jgi:hypothetical protein
MPSVAVDNAEDVIVSGVAGGAGAVAATSDNPADAVWVGELLSLTAAVKLNVPPVVGVPEITPVLAWSVTPAGRLPEVTDHM